MSFDQYDYPALSRTPLFRYGYGQGGGLRKTNVLADMLNGLANGVQNFQAARQQSAQQDQANQTQALQRQLLQGQIDHQGLVNDQLRQSATQAQSAPAVDAMRQALQLDPSTAPTLLPRMAAAQSGMWQFQPPTPARTATNDAELGENATSVGTEGNVPATSGNLFDGVSFDPARAGREQQAQALRNLMIGKLTSEAPQYRNPQSLMSAVSQLANGAQLGQATSPGFQYSPADGSTPPATVGGFPTHVNPVLPPNTVDLGEAYRMAGPTRWEDQQANAQRLADRKQQAAMELQTLKNDPKQAGTVGRFRSQMSKAYLDSGGDPSLLSVFLDSETRRAFPGGVNPPASPAAGYAPAPGGATPAPPEGADVPAGSPAPADAGTHPNFFPSGTAAQARMGLQGAQAGLAGARAADIPEAAQDRRQRVNNQTQQIENQQAYQDGILQSRQRALDIQQALGQGRLSLAQAQAAFKQQFDLDRQTFRQWQAQNPGGGSSPQVKLLQQRINQVGQQINRFSSAGDYNSARALTRNYQDLLNQFDDVTSGNAGGSGAPSSPPAPQARPTVPSRGGIPALPPATAQNLGMSGPDPQQAQRAAYRDSLARQGATPHEINLLTRKKFGGI